MEKSFSFGYWLRRQRLAHDLRQAELARQLGVATITLRKIEADERRPSLQLIERLAALFALNDADRTLLLHVARAEVSPATLALPEQPRAVDHLAYSAPATRRHNLPSQTTTLIGRERELIDLYARMTQPDVRLVTLTGPGGIGKTRLALQVASDLLDAFPQGVWFVNLAPISHPARVIPAIAQTLGVRERAERPLVETLHDALREQRLLLVIDNFEQVAEAASAVAALLAAAPFVRVLVTSRAALHLSGEHLVAVAPLALPGQAAPLEQLTQCEAVRLFIERARLVRAGFAVTSADVAAIAESCMRLDGLPLAIELAAARMRLFTPQALLARLDRRLQLLVGGPRDLPQRQQTLRATITWSYTLLGQAEQRLLRGLSLFVGGCTFEAAAAVCRADAAAQADTRVLPSSFDSQTHTLEGLASLVDKSLLRREDGPDGEPRFSMLQTIREYALEQLEEQGEAAATRARHAAYMLELAEQAAPELYGPQARVWMDRLEAEHDNLRAALTWYAATPLPVQLARACYALWRFWWVRGHWVEGWHWANRALDAGSAALVGQPLLWARVLWVSAMLLVTQSEFKRSRTLGEQSLQLFQAQDDMAGQADALQAIAHAVYGLDDYAATMQHLSEAERISRAIGDQFRTAANLYWRGYISFVLGDPVAAQAIAEAALSMFRALGSANEMAAALGDLGFIAHVQGDQERAANLLEESIVLLRQAGDLFMLSGSLNYLGQVMLAQGNTRRTIELCGESLALRRALGDRRGSTAVMINLADAMVLNGDLAQAHKLITNQLALARELEYHQGYSWGLRIAARVALASGAAAHAARLLGADAAVRAAHNLPIWPDEQPMHDRSLAALHAVLSEQAFTAAWEAGYLLSLEAALELAVQPLR